MPHHERPSAFAPYALGVLLSTIGGAALLVNAIGGYADDPGGSRTSLVLLVAAPCALAVFGFLSAVPHRRRRRRLEAMFPESLIVDVIVLPTTRATLQLDDELRRSYTASLVFAAGGFTVWKRGTFGVRRCGEVTHQLRDVGIGTATVSSVTVAALTGTLDGGAPLQLPLLSPRSPFTMAAGSAFVDRVVRAISKTT
ncbi:hypothetical protein ACLBWP_01250 [Microbacterium sp. M1A1_1b]|uniref:hypothetical protein n=1 Tax=Curtobacterium sp. VKM Ac-2922 TaxID=2929475 RepID=UPI001FB1E6C4|nr:hypothetical protein [Curtobacterium sp. VKM Ac-2922]MCJ1714828.1 hypothetical protein [Curtobacterium sp. VKM Ac-2922]